MRDGRNREIEYIRISITDRCNLRCVYCMPKEGVPCIEHQEILTYEEIERLCRIFVKLGIHKFKVTGGEPLVRKNCDVLIDKLHKIEGVESITMTTNGVLLPDYVESLVQAGLSAVNVSLDSMDAAAYEEITGRNEWKNTITGVEAALKYPSLQVKINCVPVRGANETELIKIAELARNHNIHVRFIEMMPIGLGKDFEFMGEEEVKELLEKDFGPFTLYSEILGNGPAHYYKVEGFQGKIGFISARTHKFCDTCNRIRLTSDGFLKTCLQYNSGCDLKKLLRAGETDETIEKVIRETLLLKPDCHHFEEEIPVNNEEHKNMSSIGG